LHKIIYTLLIASTIIGGCSASRRAGTGMVQPSDEANETILTDVAKNNISNYGFNISRADIIYSLDGVSGKLTVGIKSRGLDTLLVAVRHSTGVEIARIFLTTDTLLINDRINRRVMYGDPEYLEKRYGIERNMILLVLGDIFLMQTDRNRNENCQKGLLSIQTRLEDGRINYEIDCKLRKITSATLNRASTNDRITVSYSNFIKRGNHILPGRIEVEDMKNRAVIRVDIRSVDIPWKGNIDFVHGTRYKIMRIK
jgi:hypothetical protein